jgi:iron complex transport system ATP-binding protein
MKEQPALEVSDLSVGHGSTALVEAMDLRLMPATVTALLGANGKGKSTLMRTLAGLHAPLAGTVRVCGKELGRMSAAQRARLLAWVTTTRPAGPALDVQMLVGLGRLPWTGRWGTFSARDKAIVEQAMEQAGIVHLRHRPLAACSDGERQKAVIARALAQDTPLLLLDEPTAYLDLPNRAALLHLLRSQAVQHGRMVLFSTHDIQAALDLSDHLVLLQGERAWWHGTPRDAADSGVLRSAFAGVGVQFLPDGTHHFRKPE